MSRYPDVAGHKAGGTSAAAAPDGDELSLLRRLVLRAIAEAGPEGRTADEAASALALTPFSTRPRCTELQALGRIRDSGRRRANASGRPAIVWVSA
jgi:hypothetical protein